MQTHARRKNAGDTNILTLKIFLKPTIVRARAGQPESQADAPSSSSSRRTPYMQYPSARNHRLCFGHSKINMSWAGLLWRSTQKAWQEDLDPKSAAEDAGTVPARLRLGIADHRHKTFALNIHREGQTHEHQGQVSP